MEWKHVSRIGCVLGILVTWTILAGVEKAPPSWGGATTWNKTFGGSDYDVGYSVQQTTDGGYIVAGYTASYGAGNDDVWLIKTDALGNEQWNKTFGGSDYDEGRSVQQTTDGGYIVAGYTASYGAGSYDVWLIKTDALGNEQWNKTFGGSDRDYGYSVQQTTDGGYVVAGYNSICGDGQQHNLWLIKTNGSGDLQWMKSYTCLDVFDDFGYSVVQTTDGGYIVAGTTYTFDYFQVLLIKTDALGNAPPLP